MELPNTLISDKIRSKKAFTLIELLLVMALFVMILSFGLAIGFDSYKRDTLRTERNTIISALQKARSQAVNNINNDEHGFYVHGVNYIVFEGTFYGEKPSKDLIIPRNTSITVSGLTQVAFEQLSGDATPTLGNIVLSDGISSTTVSINQEGRIEW